MIGSHEGLLTGPAGIPGESGLAYMMRMTQWIKDAPKREHEEWLKQFNLRCDLYKQIAIAEIRKKFHEAFPLRYYAFLVQRPIDSSPWPAIYTNLKLAQDAYGRVTPVKEVLF